MHFRRYTEAHEAEGPIEALLGAAGHSCLHLVATTPMLRRFFSPLLPKPGDGPPESFRAGNSWCFHLYGWTSEEGKTKRKMCQVWLAGGCWRALRCACRGCVSLSVCYQDTSERPFACCIVMKRPAQESCFQRTYSMHSARKARAPQIMMPNSPFSCLQAHVSGDQDPSYRDTSRIVLEAALCLALQGAELKEKGCLQGGVLTPASAMGTVLIKRLKDAGIKFEIIKSGKDTPKSPVDKLRSQQGNAHRATGAAAATGSTSRSQDTAHHAPPAPALHVLQAAARAAHVHARSLQRGDLCARACSCAQAGQQHAHPAVRIACAQLQRLARRRNHTADLSAASFQAIRLPRQFADGLGTHAHGFSRHITHQLQQNVQRVQHVCRHTMHRAKQQQARVLLLPR